MDVKTFFDSLYSNILNHYTTGKQQVIKYLIKFIDNISNAIVYYEYYEFYKYMTLTQIKSDKAWLSHPDLIYNIDFTKLITFFCKIENQLLFNSIVNIFSNHNKVNDTTINYLLKKHQFGIIKILYGWSLNMHYIRIYKWFNIDNKAYYIFQNKFDEIVKKYNINPLLVRPTIYDLEIGNEFKPEYIANHFDYLYNNLNYNLYCELWDFVSNYTHIIEINEEKIEYNPPQKKSYYKKKSIPAALKNIVWRKYFNNTIDGICVCCKIESISYGNFDCGHVVAEKNGGLLELSNLRPICRKCNTSMGTKNMDEFIKEYGLN